MTVKTLEQLLRDTGVRRGSINLLRIDGQWRATVCHHGGHMVHPFEDWHGDPVEALTVALVEDERLCRDLSRRYAQAPKLGGEVRTEPTSVAGALPVLDPDFDDMEDVLG